MITDLTNYFTFLDTGMFTIKPAWGVSTAASHGNTTLWNLVTTLSRHAIPLWYHYVIWSSSIALHVTLIRVTQCTISLIKVLVAIIRTFFRLSCEETEGRISVSLPLQSSLNLAQSNQENTKSLTCGLGGACFSK